MAKMKLSSGFTTRVLSAVAGGAVNAAYDKYINPVLPTSIQPYAKYVKIGVGALLPALAKKNNMLASIGDVMMGVGASEIVSDLLNNTSKAVSGIVRVNRAPFPRYRSVAGAAAGEEKKTVNNFVS